MKRKKYFYYVALFIKGNSVTYISGVQINKDFSILYAIESIANSYNIDKNEVIISFFKEISKESYNEYINRNKY